MIQQWVNAVTAGMCCSYHGARDLRGRAGAPGPVPGRHGLGLTPAPAPPEPLPAGPSVPRRPWEKEPELQPRETPSHPFPHVPVALLCLGHGLGKWGISNTPSLTPVTHRTRPGFSSSPLAAVGLGVPTRIPHMWRQEGVLPEGRGTWPGAFHRPECLHLIRGHPRSRETQSEGSIGLKARAAQGSPTQTQHPQRPIGLPLWMLGPAQESGAQEGVCGPRPLRKAHPPSPQPPSASSGITPAPAGLPPSAGTLAPPPESSRVHPVAGLREQGCSLARQAPGC